MPTKTRPPKSKITVALSADLVEELDALTQTSQAGSRSELVEEALHAWLHKRAKKELERQTEEYYRSLTPAEHKEDQQWSKIAARSAKRFWDNKSQ